MNPELVEHQEWHDDDGYIATPRGRTGMPTMHVIELTDEPLPPVRPPPAPPKPPPVPPEPPKPKDAAILI